MTLHQISEFIWSAVYVGLAIFGCYVFIDWFVLRFKNWTLEAELKDAHRATGAAQERFKNLKHAIEAKGYTVSVGEEEALKTWPDEV